MPSKKSRVRFYADECIPVPSVTNLRTKGISVIHAYDKNYIQKSDAFHLRISKKLERVLISLDKDFKKFSGVSLNGHPGVILISVGNVTPQHINAVLDKVMKNISEEYVKESLVRATIDKLKKEKAGIVTEKTVY